MALEPVPDGEMSPSPSGETLEHVVRDQLERQLRRRGTGPTISVLGVADERATLLRHGFDRPADLVLGFVLPDDLGLPGATVTIRDGSSVLDGLILPGADGPLAMGLALNHAVLGRIRSSISASMASASAA